MTEWKKIEPDVWKPSVDGDTVEGVLIKYEEASGNFNSKVYHLETKDKKQIVIFGTTVLNDRMSYLNIGDDVKIIYRGVQKNQKAQDVKIFEVFKKA